MLYKSWEGFVEPTSVQLVAISHPKKGPKYPVKVHLKNKIISNNLTFGPQKLQEGLCFLTKGFIGK